MKLVYFEESQKVNISQQWIGMEMGPVVNMNVRRIEIKNGELKAWFYDSDQVLKIDVNKKPVLISSTYELKMLEDF